MGRLGRPPIGKKAMTGAERQRRRRAMLPFDAEGLARKLATRIASAEDYKALIAAMAKVSRKPGRRR